MLHDFKTTQAQRAAMFDFVLVDYGNADATIYPNEDAAACDIASGEIGGVVRVYRVTFDVPPRDISGDIAEKAWAKMASGYEDGHRDRIPEFIEQNMDLDGAIEELMAERSDEAAHVRYQRGFGRP